MSAAIAAPAPIQTWNSIDEYLSENPDAHRPMYDRLMQGHLLNTGHEWHGKLHKSIDGIIYYERACC